MQLEIILDDCKYLLCVICKGFFPESSYFEHIATHGKLTGNPTGQINNSQNISNTTLSPPTAIVPSASPGNSLNWILILKFILRKSEQSRSGFWKWNKHIYWYLQNKSASISADRLDNRSHFIEKDSHKPSNSTESSPTNIHNGTIPIRIEQRWLIDNSEHLEFAEDELDSVDSSEESDEEGTREDFDEDFEGDESMEAGQIDKHKKWIPRPECKLDREAMETYDSLKLE